jgi:hypothetical protein
MIDGELAAKLELSASFLALNSNLSLILTYARRGSCRR